MNTVLGSSVAMVMLLFSSTLVSLFNIPDNLEFQAKYVICILAFIQIANSMLQPWGAVLNAEDRYLLTNMLSLWQQVLVFVGLNLIRFIPISPLVGLSIIWTLPSLLTNTGVAIWLISKKPFLRLDYHYISWVDCRNLFSLGGWSSLISFASSLYERTDQVLINLMLGPVFNAAYAVVIQLGNSVSRLVTALTDVLLPTASRIASGGSVWEKQQLIIRTTRYVLILALPCAAGITIFRQEIIELWLGRSFQEAINILPLTIFLVFCRIPIFVTWPYLTAVNQLKLPALTMLLDGVINVALSVFYVKAFNLGLAGIVLGTLSTNIIRFTCFQIPFVARLIELPVIEYWKQGYGRAVLSMLWLTPSLYLIYWLNLDNFLTILMLVLVSLMYIVWVWFRVFEPYERNLFSEISARISSKRKVENS